jgi:quercetin dioxygenase-like cupin family protein
MSQPAAEPGPVDLAALATELLDKATAAHARRASHTLAHPVDGLRQTVIALLAGVDLGEHESPGAASLQVLRGQVRVVAGNGAVALRAGEIAPVPMQRHGVHADEDSVVLLSVAVEVEPPG